MPPSKLQQRINEQAQWMVEHGQNLAGYLLRYGSARDPNHYGDGGEAIYAADYAEMRKLIEQGIRVGLYPR